MNSRRRILGLEAFDIVGRNLLRPTTCSVKGDGNHCLSEKLGKKI